MRKYFNLIILSSFLVVLLILGITALLLDIEETESVTFTSGKVSYTITGNIKTGLIVPGENLINTPITLTNNSTVSHTLRVSVELKLDSNAISLDGSDGYIALEDLTSNFSLESDGYYHYQELDYEIISSVNNIILISNLVLNGYQVQNQFNDKKFEVTIKLYVRQFDNISWEDLGSINFETGLPN